MRLWKGLHPFWEIRKPHLGKARKRNVFANCLCLLNQTAGTAVQFVQWFPNLTTHQICQRRKVPESKASQEQIFPSKKKKKKEENPCKFISQKERKKRVKHGQLSRSEMITSYYLSGSYWHFARFLSPASPLEGGGAWNSADWPTHCFCGPSCDLHWPKTWMVFDIPKSGSTTLPMDLWERGVNLQRPTWMLQIFLVLTTFSSTLDHCPLEFVILIFLNWGVALRLPGWFPDQVHIPFVNWPRQAKNECKAFHTKTIKVTTSTVHTRRRSQVHRKTFLVSWISWLVFCSKRATHNKWIWKGDGNFTRFLFSSRNHGPATDATAKHWHCQTIDDKGHTWDRRPLQCRCACVGWDYLNTKTLYHIFYKCTVGHWDGNSCDQRNGIFPWKLSHILDRNTSRRRLNSLHKQMLPDHQTSDLCTSSYWRFPWLFPTALWVSAAAAAFCVFLLQGTALGCSETIFASTGRAGHRSPL